MTTPLLICKNIRKSSIMFPIKFINHNQIMMMNCYLLSMIISLFLKDCWRISAESPRVIPFVLSFCLCVVPLELMLGLTRARGLYTCNQVSRTLPQPTPPPSSVTQLLILATNAAGLVLESWGIFQSGTVVWRSASRADCEGTQCSECRTLREVCGSVSSPECELYPQKTNTDQKGPLSFILWLNILL